MGPSKARVYIYKQQLDQVKTWRKWQKKWRSVSVRQHLEGIHCCATGELRQINWWQGWSTKLSNSKWEAKAGIGVFIQSEYEPLTNDLHGHACALDLEFEKQWLPTSTKWAGWGENIIERQVYDHHQTSLVEDMNFNQSPIILDGWELVSYIICYYKRDFFLMVPGMKLQLFICQSTKILRIYSCFEVMPDLPLNTNKAHCPLGMGYTVWCSRVLWKDEDTTG